MDQFNEWCLSEGTPRMFSSEQLMQLAERLSGNSRIDADGLERIMREMGISKENSEEEMRKQILEKMMDELQQNHRLRERIAQNLERRLNSQINYDSSQSQGQKFEDFRSDMEGQTEEKIESGEEDSLRDSKDFRPGDKIMMNAGASGEYRYTKEGSEGIVVKNLGRGKYYVKFTKQTGEPDRGTETWDVHSDFMERESLKDTAKKIGGPGKLAKKMVQESIDDTLNEATKEQIEQMKERERSKLMEKVTGELNGSKLFRGADDGSYEINQLELMEMLGKKAYEEAMEMASFKKKPVQNGRHKSKVEQHSGISARHKKTGRVSAGLAVLPTLRNSLMRRRAAGGALLHEDDLEAYDSEKKVSYAVEFLIDANKCITKNVSGTKQAALALYYMMKKFYPNDKYEFIKFNDDAKVIKLDELLTMELAGCRDHGKAVDLGIERLKKQNGKQKVMYLITDGNPCGWGKGDERKSGLLEKAIELRKNDIQLVILAMCERDSSFHRYAEKVAQVAGGLVYHVEDPSKLSQYTVQSFKDIRRRK